MAIVQDAVGSPNDYATFDLYKDNIQLYLERVTGYSQIDFTNGVITIEGELRTKIINLLEVAGNTIEFGEDDKDLTYDPIEGDLFWDGSKILTEANLPEFGFPTTPVQHIQFAPNVTPSVITHVNGKWFWDSVKQQPAYYVRNENTQVNPGYEQVVPILNNTGGTVLNGTIVYPVGYADDLDGVKAFQIGLADNQFKERSQTIAVVTQDLADGESGNATTFGLASDISLVDEGFTAVGETIYLGTNGTITPTRS